MKTVILGCMLCLCAFAPSYAASQALNLDQARGPDFASQRAAIERDLADGETYVELAPESRVEVMASLDAMQRMIDAAGSVDAMAPPEQVELFNIQEEVNQTLMVAAEDSRLVCKRERRVGSNFVVSSCQTLAEQRRQREASAEALRQGTLTPASVLGD